MPGKGAAWEIREGDETRPLPVDLANFTYDRLGGYGTDLGSDITRIDAAPLIAWVEQSVPAGHSPGEGYVPQPYMQLATTLRDIGAESAADAVDYARLSHRMKTRERPSDWLVDLASKVFVGFGVYPERALYWFAALVLAGWGLARWSPDLRARGIWARFFYSLENAMPLIALSQGFESYDHSPNRWVANFYHFQKIAGFILATVLVGALTLLGG
ncbi:hypothetical protein [Palleronia caenipelagi]|uniref:Uncharacterized protein n=1 Tax=Palleronia caenipelagi TaxID=2489174 RepID=A0A547Q063_9RHOB|nr:hypothetical protein [Palleronia caenipelagi]TRD19773.1 hypothetical protein FEV53_10775 [Palleronia caenipelagi]